MSVGTARDILGDFQNRGKVIEHNQKHVILDGRKEEHYKSMDEISS